MKAISSTNAVLKKYFICIAPVLDLQLTEEDTRRLRSIRIVDGPPEIEEDTSKMLYTTKSEEREFGVGSNGHDEFVNRINFFIVGKFAANDCNCSKIEDLLNSYGHRSFMNGRWNKRLVASFSKSFMKKSPRN